MNTLTGECHNKDCPYQHIDPESKIKDCFWYDRGYCKHGTLIHILDTPSPEICMYNNLDTNFDLKNNFYRLISYMHLPYMSV